MLTHWCLLSVADEVTKPWKIPLFDINAFLRLKCGTRYQHACRRREYLDFSHSLDGVTVVDSCWWPPNIDENYTAAGCLKPSNGCHLSGCLRTAHLHNNFWPRPGGSGSMPDSCYFRSQIDYTARCRDWTTPHQSHGLIEQSRWSDWHLWRFCQVSVSVF